MTFELVFVLLTWNMLSDFDTHAVTICLPTVTANLDSMLLRRVAGVVAHSIFIDSRYQNGHWTRLKERPI